MDAKANLLDGWVFEVQIGVVGLVARMAVSNIVGEVLGVVEGACVGGEGGLGCAEGVVGACWAGCVG